MASGSLSPGQALSPVVSASGVVERGHHRKSAASPAEESEPDDRGFTTDKRFARVIGLLLQVRSLIHGEPSACVA